MSGPDDTGTHCELIKARLSNHHPGALFSLVPAPALRSPTQRLRAMALSLEQAQAASIIALTGAEAFPFFVESLKRSNLLSLRNSRRPTGREELEVAKRMW
jgi:hypothetical protein